MVYTLSSILVIAIATTSSLLFSKQHKLAKVLITLSTLLALSGTTSFPALAATNLVPSTLSSSLVASLTQPLKFEEDLLISTDQFEGVCIAKGQTGTQSDSDLLQALRSNVTNSDNLDIKVDSSAVYLGGSVKNEATARNLLKQVEKIPGIHLITVELALTNQA